MRNERGQFIAGSSGNLDGCPKDKHKFAALARSYTAEVIDTLVHLMRIRKDGRGRGVATPDLPDWGWGKAKVEWLIENKQDYISALRTVNKHLRQV